ncbi:hypothetical protein N431DRAFT_407050 [Stipitochalara longipes BDJ]|nr:hypothetical protein N431DRAFT_407050 [Stipitochalara longipes BDJ]
MTSTEVLSSSIVSGSLTFVDTMTIISVDQNLACEDGGSSACNIDSKPSGAPVDIVLTETLLTTNAANDAMSVTTTITLPRSTITIKVSSVSSASTSVNVTASGSTSVYTTATLQDKCYQPMLPLLEPCNTDLYPEVTTIAPLGTPALINGTRTIATHQSAALPLGAYNLFKPVIAFVKGVSAFGFGFGKETTKPTGWWSSKLGYDWIEDCWKTPRLYSPPIEAPSSGSPSPQVD